MAGKIDRRLFEKYVRTSTGAVRGDVLLGPAFGMDFGLVDIGGGRVMAVSADPIWVDRSYGLWKAAWFAFHTIVGDVAVSGLSPSHLILDWNLPLISGRELGVLFGAFHTEARKIGMAIVGGHTGVYEGSSFPTVGGGTAIAVGEMKNVIRPDGARTGDMVMMTKGPAIETAVALCYRFGDVVDELVGRTSARKLRSMFFSMSVVREAIAASSFGGVSSMHDASERGIAAALNELSSASGVRFDIDHEKVVTAEPVSALCSALRINPYCCSSEGTLLLTVGKREAEGLKDELESAGISAFIIGSATGKGTGVRLKRKGGVTLLRTPSADHLQLALDRASAIRGGMTRD